MIYLYTLLLIETMLIVIMYVYNRGDYMTPSFLSLAGFFAATLSIIYNKDYWDVSYSSQTFNIVSVGFALIFFVDLYFSMRYKAKKKFEECNHAKYLYIKRDWYRFICVFMTIGFIELLYEVYRIGSLLGKVGVNLLGAVKESDLNFSVLGKLFYQANNLFLIIVLFVFAYNIGAGKESKWLARGYIYPIIIGLFTLILTGSRSILFRTVFVYVVVCLIVNRRITNNKKGAEIGALIKEAVIPLGSMVIVFYALRTLVKATSKSASRAFMEYVTYYIGSPLYLFDKYLQAPSKVTGGSDYFGAFTFAGFYQTLYKMGVVSEEVPNLNYLYLGGNNYLGGNEYSLFMRPMQDFGILGMYLFIAILFSVFSYIYYFKIKNGNGTNKNNRCLMVYSYFFYIIPLCFFYPFTVQESKLMNIVYVLVLIVLYKLMVRRREFD